MESEQQEEMNYNTPMQQYGSNIIKLTNPEPLILQMELTYRGQVKNESGKIIQVGDPLMNEEGINSITGQVRSLVNQVAIMSDLDDYKLSELVIGISDIIIKDLMVNRVKYDIKIPVARDRILNIATTTCFLSARRAWKGGERSFWKNSTMDVTHRNIQEGAKSGFLQNFGRMFN